jgi:hypothetical protein
MERIMHRKGESKIPQDFPGMRLAIQMVIANMMEKEV